ncbi:MAG: hypothetical protein Q9M50_02095 [Methylococcales bacterium]|nr:hypothetical protein [Methylococcales bacterium]
MATQDQTKLKDAGIQQLSINYNTAEDRLLFKIGLSNDCELNAWLTRRIAQSLATLLNKTSLKNTTMDHKLPTNKSLQLESQITPELSKNTLSKNLDFATKYQPRKPIYSEQVFLINRCDLLNYNQDSMALELTCTNKQSIKLALNEELLMALTNMLQIAARQANWDIVIADSFFMQNPANTSHLLH